MDQRTGIFVGLNKGFIVTKPKAAANGFKNGKSYSKGKSHDRVKGVREVIAEICGLSPFERKMCELIRTGIPSKEKRAVKLARRKLGGQGRANRKRDQINDVLRAQKKQAQDKVAAAKEEAK